MSSTPESKKVPVRIDWLAIWAALLLTWSAVCFVVWLNYMGAFYLVLVAIFVAILRGQRAG